jgi:hypothetical protein
LEKVVCYGFDGYHTIQFYLKHKFVERKVGEKYLARARTNLVTLRPPGSAQFAQVSDFPPFLLK